MSLRRLRRFRRPPSRSHSQQKISTKVRLCDKRTSTSSNPWECVPSAIPSAVRRSHSALNVSSEKLNRQSSRLSTISEPPRLENEVRDHQDSRVTVDEGVWPFLMDTDDLLSAKSIKWACRWVRSWYRQWVSIIIVFHLLLNEIGILDTCKVNCHN